MYKIILNKFKIIERGPAPPGSPAGLFPPCLPGRGRILQPEPVGADDGRPATKGNFMAECGGIDRTPRVLVGLALLSLILLLDGNARWWGLIGLVPLATGCSPPARSYAILGVNTCPLGRRPSA